MCGLVAMIARRGAGFNYQDIKQLENLMIVDSTRGRDSTGLVNIKRDREVNFIKHANEPAVLFQSRYWEEFKKEIYSGGMISFGHNRAATRGAVSSENAHPFVEDNIVLIHNGTLTSHSNLTKESVSVDSHAITHALQENDDIEEVVKKINGAFALIWWDTKKDKLFAIRNSERPLVITETPEFYILTSEPWMAWGTSSQVNRKIDSARMLNAGELLSFEVGGKMESTAIDLAKPVTYTYPQQQQRGRHPHACGWESDYEADNENFGLVMRPADTAHHVTPVRSVDTAIQDISNLQPPRTTGTTASKGALLIAKKEGTLVKDIDEPFVKGMIIGGQDAHPYFKRQAMTEFRISELSRLDSGRIKFLGKCSEVGMPLADIVGLMPIGFDIVNDGPSSYGTPWYGRILSVREPVCGLSVLVVDTFKAHTLTTYGGNIVAMQVWAKIKMNCKCRLCNKDILEGDKYVTNVLTPKIHIKECPYPINQLEVKCADCIEENVPAGELTAKFNLARAKGWAEVDALNTRKAAPLQDGKSVSKQSSAGNGTAIVVPDSKTVH